jgi:hypothetical protein
MSQSEWEHERAAYYEEMPADDRLEYEMWLDTLDVNDHPPEVEEESFPLDMSPSEEPPW